MPNEVILPRVDMDMATGKISKWLVAPGATVAKGQPLFEIETDKATMEIEAEAAGTIRDLAEAGSADIPVGSVVAWIFGENEAATASAHASSGKTDLPATSALAQTEIAATSPSSVASSLTAPSHERGASQERRRATPLARRLARMDGIDLGTLTGSGPRGRIQAADVAEPRDQARSLPTPVVEPPPTPPSDAKDVASPAAVPVTAPPTHHTGLKRLRDGIGRPLLFVHGFGAEANAWRPFLQGQAFQRPVYGLDLPGHGTAALGHIAGFHDLVDAVGASVAELDGADVVAHSLGAAVMIAVASRGFADLRSLLLLAPAGLGPEINGGFIGGFLAACSEAALAPWMAELVADPRMITPAFVRSTLKARAGTDQVASQRHIAATLFPDGTQSFSIRAELATLRVPTRIVFGTADRIIPSRHAVGLPPLVALHLLPGIGHMPQVEAADTVAAIFAQITAF